MIYKICLDDDSFIIADENYKLTLFYHHKKKVVTLRDYLLNNRMWRYHLVDMIDGKKHKRYFKVSEYAEFDPTIFGITLGSRLKLAKDIKEHDLLVAPDGSPRRVKELHTGEEEMFEISVNGNTYTVNGGHILALVDKENGEHLEIPVNVYMHLDDEFRSHYVMEAVKEE